MIYDFNKAAITQMHPDVITAMVPFMQMQGNPSSMDKRGRAAKKALDTSREIIAAAMGANPDEIYFTSGGSEANNFVINGLRNPFKFHPAHIISTEMEHHSVTEAIKLRQSERKDIEYTLIKPKVDGVMDINSISDAFKLATKLCSVQIINNELGTIQTTSVIGQKCRDNNILYHADAVQAFGHIPINVKSQYIDLMSVTSQKIGGPCGIGALYVSNDCKSQFRPFIAGGQQERGMKAGTENVAGAVGFAKAVEIAVDHMRSNLYKENLLFKDLIEGLNNISDVHIHGNLNVNDHRHINIGIDGIRAEELIAMLNEQDISISSGSACNSHSNKPSHVLKAIGLSDEEANSSIRISFDHTNTESEIKYLLRMLVWDIDILRKRQLDGGEI